MADKWSSKPRIAVSRDLKRRLDELKGSSETYEGVLEGLLRGNLEPRDSTSTSANQKSGMDKKNSSVETVEKTVKKIGNGVHVCVPKEWTGGKVLVCLKKESCVEAQRTSLDG